VFSFKNFVANLQKLANKSESIPKKKQTNWNQFQKSSKQIGIDSKKVANKLESIPKKSYIWVN